jgi:hypothetical protein
MAYMRVLIRGVSRATHAQSQEPKQESIGLPEGFDDKGVSQATQALVKSQDRSRLAYLRVLMIRGSHRPPRL